MNRPSSYALLLMALAFLACTGSGIFGPAAPMRIETSMEVACPGSTVTVKWDNPKQYPFSLTAPNGAQIHSGSESSGTASFVATTGGSVTATISSTKHVSVPFEVVANNVRTIDLLVTTSCTTSNNLIGVTGQFAGPGVFDPRLKLNHIEAYSRTAVDAKHAGKEWWASSGVDVVPAVDLPGTWTFFSPLEAYETCSPVFQPPAKAAPTAITVELRTQCSP